MKILSGATESDVNLSADNIHCIFSNWN